MLVLPYKEQALEPIIKAGHVGQRVAVGTSSGRHVEGVVEAVDSGSFKVREDNRARTLTLVPQSSVSEVAFL